MKFFKSLMVIAVVAVSACSKPAPSESDAKKVVQSMLGDCRHFTLASFEKVNGVPEGENNYQVSIKYSIDVTAAPENVKAIAESAETLAEIDERLASAKNLRAEIHEKMGAIEDKASKEYQELYSQSWQVGPLADKIEAEKRNLIRNSINPINTLISDCPNVNPAFYSAVFSEDGIDQYAKSFTKEFSGTIGMVKTDNGWMPTN